MLKNAFCFGKGENSSAVPSMGNIVEYLRRCLQIAEDKEMVAILENELRNLEQMNKLKTHELVLLFVLNALMIAFGAFGASCVIAVEIRKRRMRTAQNLFTLNLAVSDLTLCLFTQPFNLLRTLHWHYEWNFGEFMCKFTAFAQATNVFVATMSITAIAVDRFRLIVHPLRSKRPWHKPTFVLPLIWLIAFIMASPMLAFSSVTTSFSIKQRKLCTESSSSVPQLQYVKYTYGIFTIILQYVVPFFILTCVYIRICTRIKKLTKTRVKLLGSTPAAPLRTPTTQTRLSSLPIEDPAVHDVSAQRPENDVEVKRISLVARRLPLASRDSHGECAMSAKNQRRQLQLRRQRRANILLTCVALAFVLSWLPLNVVNILMDYREAKVNQVTPITSVLPLSPLGQNTEPDLQSAGKNTTRVNSTKEGDSEMAEPGTSEAGAQSEYSSPISARVITLIQSFCLICVLCSCCLNPFFYGYLNDDFRAALMDILCCRAPKPETSSSIGC
ncbi:unnamed protein product [Schistocephalus solidus]|uniref:G_PROTEIN_RECEP_F1_2 domain-containing protein n=1 Tax=Schistocephalus solidus TaxID=70667 RepID=A0A183SM12_SCHSO|nr:unnamed protein product [Schistocephalus solidus]